MPATGENEPSRPLLRLYVVGRAINSRIARSNLEAFLMERKGIDVEIVDVARSPEIALKEGVFVTPFLKSYDGSCQRVVYGTLEDPVLLEQLLSISE